MERVTLGLGVVSSTPTSGVEVTLKNKKKKPQDLKAIGRKPDFLSDLGYMLLDVHLSVEEKIQCCFCSWPCVGHQCLYRYIFVVYTH